MEWSKVFRPTTSRPCGYSVTLRDDATVSRRMRSPFDLSVFSVEVLRRGEALALAAILLTPRTKGKPFVRNSMSGYHEKIWIEWTGAVAARSRLRPFWYEGGNAGRSRIR